MKHSSCQTGFCFDFFIIFHHLHHHFIAGRKLIKMLKTRALLSLAVRHKVNDCTTRGLKQTLNRIKVEYDTNYLTNPANFNEIKSNIANRKGVGDIERLQELVNELSQTTDASRRVDLQNQLQVALKSIPNRTHADVVDYGDKPKEIDSIGSKRNFDFKPRTLEDLCEKLNILRTNELGNLTGSRSYYFMNELAELVSLAVGGGGGVFIIVAGMNFLFVIQGTSTDTVHSGKA